MRQIVNLIVFILCRLGTAQVQPLIPIHPSLQGHLLRSRRDEILPNYQPTDSLPTYSDNGNPQKSMSHPTYVEVHPTPNHENDLPAYEAQKHFQSYEERVVATTDTYLDSYEEPHSHKHDNVEPGFAKEHPLTTNQEVLGLPGYSSYEEAIHNEPNYPVEESHDNHSDLQTYSGEHLQPHTTEDLLSSNYEEAFELPNYSSSLEYVEDIQNIPNYVPTEERHDSHSDLPSYSEEHLQENYPIEQASQSVVYNQPHILESNYAEEEPSSSTYEEAFELPSQSSSLGYVEDIQNIPNYLHAEEIHDSHSILPSYSKEHLQEIYPFEQPDPSTVYNQPHNSEPKYAEEDPVILNYEKVIELPSYSSSLGYEEDIQNTPNYSHAEESHDFHSDPSSYSNEHSQDNDPVEQPSQHNYPESESVPVQYHGAEYPEIPELPLYNAAPSVNLEHDHKYGHYEQSRATLATEYQEVNNGLHNYSPTPSEDEPGQSHYEVGEPPEHGVSVENYTPHYEQNQDLPSYETRGQDPTEPQHHGEPIDYHDINEALPLYNEIESEGQAIQNHHDSHNVGESPHTSNSGMNLYPENRSEDKGSSSYRSDHPQEDPIYEEETHLYHDEPAYTVPEVHEEISEDLYHQFTDPSNEFISPPQVVYQEPPTTYTAPGSYLAPEQIMPATDYVAPGEYPQAIVSTSTNTAMTTTVTTTTTTTTTTTPSKTTTPMPTTPAPIETDRSDSFQKITLTLVQSLTTLITNVLTNPPPVTQSPAPPTVTPPQISEPQIVTAVPTLPPSPKTTVPPPTISSSTPTSKAPESVTTPMPTPLPSQPFFPSVPTPSTLPPKLLLSTPPAPPITTTPVPALPPPTPEMKMEGVKEIVKALDKMPVKMGKMPEQPQKMPLKIEKLPGKMEKMPEKMEKVPEKMEKMPEEMEKLPEKMEKLPEKMEAMPKKMEAIPKKMEAMTKKMDKMPDKMEVMPTTEDKMPEKMKQMPLESEALPKSMDKMPPKDMDPIPMKMMPMTEAMDVTTTPSSTLERAVKDLDDLIQQLSTLAG